MNYKRILLTAVCGVALLASAKQINPITQAMLDGYAELLAQDPKDYLTLYERASQYYRLSDYDSALSDVKKSIEYTPAKEKDQLASEYSLLADIYTELQQYSEALTAVDKALEYSPNMLSLINMKGNISLHLGLLEQAQNAFTTMQRKNPRSPEALFGMARVAIQQNRNNEAQQYITAAEKLDPSNYITHCRMGDLHHAMGDNKQAATDYINAFSLTSNTERPISSLLELAKKDFDAVDQAIEYALGKTTNVVPLYFLLGNAAYESGKYAEAKEAFRQLLSTPQGSDAGLQTTMADICLRTGNITEADNYASKALATKPNLRTYILKAMIEEARGNHQSALMFAQSALKYDTFNSEALLLAANATYQNGNTKDALTYLNDAIMANAENREALMFRAYLQSNEKGAQTSADFKRLAGLNAGNNKELTYKAIAQALSGTSLDAATTISNVKAQSDIDPEAAFLMALYHTATGNLNDARSMLDKARNAGFEDEYILQYYNIPLLSISPLR